MNQIYIYIYIYIYLYRYIIILSDSVDDRDQKSRYGIEVLLNLSRYQPFLGNERINTKTNTYEEYTYFAILFCSFMFCLIKNQYKLNLSLNTKKSSCI